MIQCVLALLVWAVFGQTVSYPFVDYDDQNYVYENSRITNGITANGLAAAFTQLHARNWHPITTISHMLDCQMFGLNAGGHHLVNVLLHAAAVLLLFSALNAMTGAIWRSAFVAAIFAIHPLRAESVAWIAERKDVLSGIFFMLTVCAYAGYVRRQTLGRYLATLGVFALGLMSKPTLVSLPALLLLLDYWPLKRFGGELSDQPADHGHNGAGEVIGLVNPGPLLDKLPFFLLSLVSAAVTITAQRQTVQYGGDIPLSGRLGNALLSAIAYICQMVWPAKLAAFYPDTADRLATGTVALSALVLAGITIGAVWTARQRPYLIVGWSWYLIALLPVIGIVQVGLQGRADRYTYLPQIGLYIAMVWTVTELPFAKRPLPRWIMSGAAAGIVLILAWRAWSQTAVWKNTETLWSHAISVTDNNDVAHYNVATLLMKRGQVEDAVAHYTAALRAAAPNELHNHLSPALVENSLGNAFAQKGDIDSAMIHYRKALQLRPDFSDARSNLAFMLIQKGETAAAVSEYEKVVNRPPEDAASHQRLGEMLIREKRAREALVHYRRAVEIAPDSLDALNALAWILATSSDPGVRNGPEALSLARHADQLTGGKDPVVLRILAAAYQACGDPAEAIATAEHALTFSTDNQVLVAAINAEIEMYRARR